MATGFEEVSCPRLVVAGGATDSGKTLVTSGIAAAFRRRGLRVHPFKVGPDFADSARLAQVTGAPCRNLDPWILGEVALLQGLRAGCADADLGLVEGMLGLLDSWGAGASGSTAELSKLIAAPVVLVLDVSHHVQTAAAVALGLRTARPDVQLAGVILNRAEDEEHARWVEEAVWELSKLPVLGTLPSLEVGAGPGETDALVAAVERHLDLDVLLRIAAKARPVRVQRAEPMPALEAPVRIAVAFDDAFSPYYPENLEILGEAGAELVPFSPLLDHNLPHADGVYLAGGGSERYAASLSANTRMLESLRQAADDRVPIYAECGGMMCLAESVREDGMVHPMAGALPLRLTGGAEKRRLSYRQMRVMEDCLVADRDASLRGHEYQWGRIEVTGGTVRPVYELSDPAGFKSGHEGYARPGLLASSIHVHFGQDPTLAVKFLRACARRGAAEALV